MSGLRYISTRQGSRTPVERLSFEEVVLSGLARDGGLFVPEHWPRFSPDEIAALRGLPYADLATRILAPFMADTFEPATLGRLVREAYAGFDDPQAVRLKPLPVDNLHLLELFHGPTLAFKDVALQLVGRILDTLLSRSGRRARIVGATSGDTGSAAIEAVRDRTAIDIFMLHPKGRISDVQRRQMTTVLAGNVHNVAVEGTFDDCQDLVKACFNDLAFRDRHRLTAVNSINIARVLAQIVYYFHAALLLGAPQRPVSFCVPTGNFGNVFAGYAAHAMGLPVERLLIAANSNDIIPRFFDSGEQRLGTVTPTFSPSMDIQVSSNFERFLFDLFDRDGKALAAAMENFRATGAMAVSAGQLARARAAFEAGRLDDADTLQAIAEAERECGELLDPHTAIAYAVARRQRGERSVPMVVLATAHPAKFPDAIAQATGEAPPVPARLAALASRPERYDTISNDIGALKRLMDGVTVYA